MSENSDIYASSSQPDPKPGPFLARVVSNLDPTCMGILEVEILRPVGGSQSEGQLHQVKMMSPFWGQTSVDHVGQDPDDYNNTQKSYGMWFVPPDVGTTVVIIFIDGDPKRGYWFGCVPDEAINFMVPGIASTQHTVDGTGRVPVAEYNKLVNQTATDPNQIKKPKHPLADVLEAQGLLKDDTRGITTSSARREAPSSVFGISTPGPLDKRSGAKQGAIGKKEHKIPNAPVSRLGGTTFVMDDGDDKFLRKTKAFAGPPDYVAVEQDGPAGGQPDIPHNELVRIRTRTGHQILMHNSEDLIYIGNARGTTWIEMTSMGKIDIYAKDSVSIHSENDLNFTADRDINFTAKGDINLNAGGKLLATATGNFEIKAGADGKLSAVNMNVKASAKNNFTSGADTNIKAGARLIQNASGYFSLPGGGGTSAVSGVAPTATTAPKATRVPMVEPWAGHENLNPLFTMPDSTKASAAGPSSSSPAFYQKYTTVTDTFSKVKGADGK